MRMRPRSCNQRCFLYLTLLFLRFRNRLAILSVFLVSFLRLCFFLFRPFLRRPFPASRPPTILTLTSNHMDVQPARFSLFHRTFFPL